MNQDTSVKTYVMHTRVHGLLCSELARHRSQDICSPISQIVLKNLIKSSLIIKECPEDFKV